MCRALRSCASGYSIRIVGPDRKPKRGTRAFRNCLQWLGIARHFPSRGKIRGKCAELSKAPLYRPSIHLVLPSLTRLFSPFSAAVGAQAPRASARALARKKLNADVDNCLLQNGHDLRLSREGEIAIIRTALFRPIESSEQNRRRSAQRRPEPHALRAGARGGASARARARAHHVIPAT